MKDHAFVRAIYFDTSVLRGLPFRGVTSGLKPLLSICQEFGAELWTPEICVRELVGYHERTSTELLAKLKAAFSKTHQYQKEVTKLVEPSCMSSQEVATAIEADLKAAGIGVVATPDVNVSALVDMAIKRTPPFDDSGRGFRDALILESVCAHAARFKEDAVIFATADKDFAEGELARRGDALGVRIQKHSLVAELAAVVNKEKARAIQLLHNYDAEKIIAVLEADRVRYEQAIRPLFTPSEDFVIKGTARATPDTPRPVGDPILLQLARLQRIDGARFMKFSPGGVFDAVAVERDDSREYFGLRLEAELDIVVSVFGFHEHTRFTLPAGDAPGSIQREATEPVETRYTVQRAIPLVASAVRQGDSFTDVRIERCNV